MTMRACREQGEAGSLSQKPAEEPSSGGETSACASRANAAHATMSRQFPHHLLYLRRAQVHQVHRVTSVSVWWLVPTLFLLYVPMLTGAQSQPTYPQGLIVILRYCSALLDLYCPLEVIQATFTRDGVGVQQMVTPLRMWNAYYGNKHFIVLGCNDVQHCKIDNCSGRLSRFGQVTLFAIDGSTNLGFIPQYPSRCRFQTCLTPNCHGGIGSVTADFIDMKISLRTTLKDKVAHINLTWQQPLEQAILESLQIVGVTPDNTTVNSVDNQTASIELHNICNSQIHAVSMSYIRSGTVVTSILEFTLPACSPDTPSTGTPVTEKTTDSTTAIAGRTSRRIATTFQTSTPPHTDTSQLHVTGLIVGLLCGIAVLILLIIIIRRFTRPVDDPPVDDPPAPGHDAMDDLPAPGHDAMDDSPAPEHDAMDADDAMGDPPALEHAMDDLPVPGHGVCIALLPLATISLDMC
ncbi:uncharacterized protein LOC135820991 isoform X2 [Sycon ciliatum]|uniref:uncharacterized protein LOC135820991 isoform X2 n=1 Tax=Sycon ciliatum TaxID=27933 RepID=UPI0031F64609